MNKVFILSSAGQVPGWGVAENCAAVLGYKLCYRYLARGV